MMTGDGTRSDVVGVLGIGAMGLGMLTRLAARGEVLGFDPDPVRLDMVEAAGGSAIADARDLAARSTHLILAVRDGAQLLGALFDPERGVAASLRQGSTVLVTSTVGQAVVRDTADRLADADVHLVDAPVSGGPVRAADGTLLIMVGASDAAYARSESLLGDLAGHIERVGSRPGDGQALKIVNQLLCGVHIAAAAEALSLATAMGLDPQAALTALNRGAAASFMLADRGPRMIESAAEVKSSVGIFVKDMTLVNEMADELKQPTLLAAAAKGIYLLADKHGLGESDDSAVVQVFQGLEAGG